MKDKNYKTIKYPRIIKIVVIKVTKNKFSRNLNTFLNIEHFIQKLTCIHVNITNQSMFKEWKILHHILFITHIPTCIVLCIKEMKLRLDIPTFIFYFYWLNALCESIVLTLHYFVHIIKKLMSIVVLV